MRNIIFSMLFAVLPLTAHARVHGRHKVPKLSDDRVVLHTNMGDIVLGFYFNIAPKHVAQILKMVKAGVYDGASFFRVESGFVAQVSNNDARVTPVTDAQKAVIQKIPAEFSALKHRRGILSMARYDEDVNSAESSFSILLGDAPHLDGQYTIFGEVVSGMDVVSAIENVPLKEPTVPFVNIVIERAEVVSASDLAALSLRGVQPGMVPDQQAQKILKFSRR